MMKNEDGNGVRNRVNTSITDENWSSWKKSTDVIMAMAFDVIQFPRCFAKAANTITKSILDIVELPIHYVLSIDSLTKLPHDTFHFPGRFSAATDAMIRNIFNTVDSPKHFTDAMNSINKSVFNVVKSPIDMATEMESIAKIMIKQHNYISLYQIAIIEMLSAEPPEKPISITDVDELSDNELSELGKAVDGMFNKAEDCGSLYLELITSLSARNQKLAKVFLRIWGAVVGVVINYFSGRCFETRSRAIVRESPNSKSSNIYTISANQQLVVVNSSISYYYEIIYHKLETNEPIRGYISKGTVKPMVLTLDVNKTSEVVEE